MPLPRRVHPKVEGCLCTPDSPEIACSHCGAPNCPSGTVCEACHIPAVAPGSES